jgi:hypothetical protein
MITRPSFRWNFLVVCWPVPDRTSGFGVGLGGIGVAVDGTGVEVAGIGVAVAGFGVGVGGTGVALGGTGVADGSTRVGVGGTGVGLGTGVAVAGTGVAVTMIVITTGVGVGTAALAQPPAKKDTIRSRPRLHPSPIKRGANILSPSFPLSPGPPLRQIGRSPPRCDH